MVPDAGSPATPSSPRGSGLVALGAALAVIALANAWVGVRLPVLLRETSIGHVAELERRAAAFPRERVRVLVLGNSEAIAGLRPPVVAEALGLGPDGVFSLAMVGASPQEARLTAERLLPAFPRVARVLCGVNESFLNSEAEQRRRYLTAGRLDERLAFVEGRPLEARLRLLAGTWLPVLDLGTSLRTALAERPRWTLTGLVAEPPPVPPDAAQRLHYPWGLPPQWDAYRPADLAKLRKLSHGATYVADRARRFTQDRALQGPAVAQLGRLTRDLRARGVEVVLVEMPYARRLDAAVRAAEPGGGAPWRAALDALPPESRARRLPAPAMDDDAFYDADHLAPAGARRLAAAIARALR